MIWWTVFFVLIVASFGVYSAQENLAEKHPQMPQYLLVALSGLVILIGIMSVWLAFA